MAGAVQFYGKDQVLEAFENRQCSAWAIFAGRSLFMKYELNNMDESLSFLEGALDSLMLNGTDAIYTLKCFEITEGQDKVKINEKTICDAGSFNFKTLDPLVRADRQIGYLQNQSNIVLEKKIEALEKKLKESEEDQQPQTIGEIVKDLLYRPDELAQLVNIGRMAMGLPVQNFAGMGTIGATRAGISAPGVPVESKEDALEKICGAVDRLEKHVPDLADRMQQLAEMADKDPAKFKLLISML